jgi:hypothetical protein
MAASKTSGPSIMNLTAPASRKAASRTPTSNSAEQRIDYRLPVDDSQGPNLQSARVNNDGVPSGNTMT